VILVGLKLALQAGNIFFAIGGTAIGIVMGALPGIGPAMTIALVLPLTFSMPHETALILMGAIYCGCVYGGSISAILINTPGTGASTATTFDGYPMAKKGLADEAIGISLMSSFLGGLTGALLLMFFTPFLANISLKFGPPEFFMLTVFTFVIVAAAVSKGSIIKSLIPIGVGLMFCFIGYDPISGWMRYDFGITYLQDGIQLIPTIIGLFAISECLLLAEKGGTISKPQKISGGLLKGMLVPFKYPITLIRSIAIGSGIGAIPGIGVSAANFISYVVAKRSSKHPETFGKGDVEGIIAPEASNNAVTGTSLIPLLSLGLPGSGTAAVLLGGLMMHGLIPGWELFNKYGNITYAFFFGLIMANIALIFLGFFSAKYLAKITIVPVKILIPIIISLCFIGSYSLRFSMGDVAAVIIFGFLGYIMKKLKYPLICILLPIILGTTIERSYHQSLMISEGSHLIFVTRPLCLILLFLTLVPFVLPLIKKIINKRPYALR